MDECAVMAEIDDLGAGDLECHTAEDAEIPHLTPLQW
jgi:hypothetical protein